MAQETEAQALAVVQVRLETRFPDLAHETIASAMQAELAKMDGPVRDFVPLLVERKARKRLAGLAAKREQ